MRFIIEMDGALMNVMKAYYRAHIAAAADVSWAPLEEHSFRRLLRREGLGACFLRGVKPMKLEHYHSRFAEHAESDESIAGWALETDCAEGLTHLAKHGPCLAVTVGSNLNARRALLEQSGAARRLAGLFPLSQDPRRRPGELAALSENDRRTIVVAGGEAVARAAGAANLFVAGVSGGVCNATRLHQAGVSVVFHDLAELGRSVEHGASDLVDAGLMPPGLD